MSNIIRHIEINKDDEVVNAACLQLAKFEGRSAYKTWISRIMINKCLYKLKYGYFKNETPAGQEDAPSGDADRVVGCLPS